MGDEWGTMVQMSLTIWVSNVHSTKAESVLLGVEYHVFGSFTGEQAREYRLTCY